MITCLVSEIETSLSAIKLFRSSSSELTGSSKMTPLLIVVMLVSAMKSARAITFCSPSLKIAEGSFPLRKSWRLDCASELLASISIPNFPFNLSHSSLNSLI